MYFAHICIHTRTTQNCQQTADEETLQIEKPSSAAESDDFGISKSLLFLKILIC